MLCKDIMIEGGRYNFKHQKERLIYLGYNWSGNGYWHQFAKVIEPEKVWAEVIDRDLSMMEKTITESPEDGCYYACFSTDPFHHRLFVEIEPLLKSGDAVPGCRWEKFVLRAKRSGINSVEHIETKNDENMPSQWRTRTICYVAHDGLVDQINDSLGSVTTIDYKAEKMRVVRTYPENGRREPLSTHQFDKNGWPEFSSDFVPLPHQKHVSETRTKKTYEWHRSIKIPSKVTTSIIDKKGNPIREYEVSYTLHTLPSGDRAYCVGDVYDETGVLFVLLSR